VFNISDKFVGVNIGSVSVNVVSTDSSGNKQIVKRPHLGKPKETLDEILQKEVQCSTCYYDVSG